MAHHRQQCTNFKDPGLQPYAQSALFNDLRDAADDAFMQLPPPERTAIRTAQGGQCSSISPSVPVDMSRYNNYSGGCFSGGCQVKMANGDLRRVDSVKAGDYVYSASSSKGAWVKCVVKFGIKQGQTGMVTLDGGLVVTPWHPVIKDGKWRFPNELAPTKNIACSEVYSFVLESGFSRVVINDVECITLGHGLQDDPVASHEFWGTTRVIDALKAFCGWEMGRVEVPWGTTRDQATGLVNGFVSQ